MQRAKIKPAIKQTNFLLRFVMPAKAGIQYFQRLFWIPAFRNAQPAPVKTGGRKALFYCRINNEKGSLMVIAIVILMLLTLIGIAITTTASLEMQIASNDRLHKMAFYQADGGIDIGAELLEQNLGCTNGFSDTLGGDQRNVGSVRVTDLNLSANTDTDATVPVDPTQGTTNRHFYFPENYSGSQPHTNLTVGGNTKFSTGNAIQMVSGYEGKGKGAGAGGAYIMYSMTSQHMGIAGSQSVIQVQWRHVIGMEGACNY
ncbi:MAG: pilus assembly PilX N-terminal domain-containing protein [Desulfobacterales bacterium]|nr:pilus assembly PilX N-terminal domain-containing protein [Desulfobacterales bacterium]